MINVSGGFAFGKDNSKRREWIKFARALSLTGALLCAAGLSSTAVADVLDRPFLRAASLVILIGGNDFSDNGGTAPFAVDFYLLDNVSANTQAPDIIGADGVTVNYNTGQYNASQNGDGSGYEFEVLDPVSGGVFNSTGPHQTLDANDSYTAFGINNDTSVDVDTNNRVSRFLVVSNTAFDIYAQASDLVNTESFSSLGLDNIDYLLRVQTTGGSGVWRWGESAQDPTSGGSGVVGTVDYLSDMSSGFTKVFDGGRRTAASRGSLLEQAVSFQSRYRLRRAGAVASDLADYDLSMGRGELGATVTYTIYTP